MKCEGCGIKYPNNLIKPFFLRRLDLSAKTIFVCGICALEAKNAEHSTNDTTLKGIGAERLRQGAIKWRKEHPDSCLNTQQS